MFLGTYSSNEKDPVSKVVELLISRVIMKTASWNPGSGLSRSGNVLKVPDHVITEKADAPPKNSGRRGPFGGIDVKSL